MDLCPTPLALSKEYAARKGHRIQTVACDATQYVGSLFDLILAYDFLQFFETPTHAALASRWSWALAASR